MAKTCVLDKRILSQHYHFFFLYFLSKCECYFFCVICFAFFLSIFNILFVFHHFQYSSQLLFGMIIIIMYIYISIAWRIMSYMNVSVLKYESIFRKKTFWYNQTVIWFISGLCWKLVFFLKAFWEWFILFKWKLVGWKIKKHFEQANWTGKGKVCNGCWKMSFSVYVLFHILYLGKNETLGTIRP
jgi:hypothetical protein